MERIIKRGDIYYAELNPVIGSEQGGTRPVLIISNDIGNKHSPTVIIAAITSRVHTKAKLPTHTAVTNYEGLDKDSVILLEQIRTIDKQRLKQYMGMMPNNIMASSMYTNKHAWTNKDGTYKEVYYYICGRNKQERGHHCDYKASLRKTDIEPLVIEAVKELVSDKYFAKEMADCR